MSKPLLLDLFCSAGGASEGYARAGFEVIGVDINPQPHYPHTFFQGDAFEYFRKHHHVFDAFAGSPPCQENCSLKHMHNAKKHLDLIPETREAFRSTGKPYVIENVVGAQMIEPLMLCGTMFGLGCAGAELRRHRLFESNFFMMQPECQHGREERVIGVYGGHGRDRRRKVNTQDFPTTARAEALGIDWMNGRELSQAIPPAYTQYIGQYLMAAVMEQRLVAA